MREERIDSIAPDMPDWIRKWFLDREHGGPSIENQDFDLVLADWTFVPLLAEFCENRENVLEKRFDAFSALMVLQALDVEEEMMDKKRALNWEIRRLVLQDPDFAKRNCDGWLGLPDSLIIEIILGELPSDDFPKWIWDEANRRASEIIKSA